MASGANAEGRAFAQVKSAAREAGIIVLVLYIIGNLYRPVFGYSADVAPEVAIGALVPIYLALIARGAAQDFQQYQVQKAIVSYGPAGSMPQPQDGSRYPKPPI